MTCSFCHDQPVANAGAWLSPDEPAFTACPRCGERRCAACGHPLTDADQATALREAWLGRVQVCVTLTGRCVVPMIVGRVTHVSVTSAHAIIDGWTVPVTDVRAVAESTPEHLHQYANLMRAMRKEAK